MYDALRSNLHVGVVLKDPHMQSRLVVREARVSHLSHLLSADAEDQS